LRDISDLVVVTGTTVATDWDAVFLEQTGDEATDVTFRQLQTEKTCTSIIHSSNQTLHQSSGHHHLGGPATCDKDCVAQHAPNQCIFIRSFHFKSRGEGAVKASGKPEFKNPNSIKFDGNNADVGLS
jgi:hypothetical protein